MARRGNEFPLRAEVNAYEFSSDATIAVTSIVVGSTW
jgi:hypothetical protein